jgi:nucleoside-diphosphate-sugar epimerase
MNFSELVIVGCGDIGARVAKLAAAHNINVTALSRGNKITLGADIPGVVFKQCDLDNPDTLSGMNLSGAAVLYSANPPGGGIVDTRVRNFLTALEPGSAPAKIIYISTTSVYGDCGDETVTEEKAIKPANHTAKRRCDAERRFSKWGSEHGVPVVILRITGIYGPGRIPMQRILAREPLLNDHEAGYSNRIHADDLAAVCMAALEKGTDGDIFNVCDGEVSKLTDYFNAITDLLKLPRLPQVSRDEAYTVMSPLMFSYMTESRKISNKKMLEKLGIKLKYANMLEGLKATIAESQISTK